MPIIKIIGLLVLEKILKVFAVYSHGGHLGHVTWAIYTNFRSHFLTMLHMKFGFDWPKGFRNDQKWPSYKFPFEPSDHVS